MLHLARLIVFREADGPGAAQPPESKLEPIPLIKPPCARPVAIDLNAGEIAWTVPFGEGSRELREQPLLHGVALPERLGTRDNAGPMVTRGASCSWAAASRTSTPSTRQPGQGSRVGQLRFEPARTR